MGRLPNLSSMVAIWKWCGNPLGYIFPLLGCRPADSCDGMDERPVTPQVMGCDGPVRSSVMAWMAAVRFEPIRGPEQISRPIDCFPLCPKILFMQPRQAAPNAALIFPASSRLYGIITIKKMEGKLEGQHSLFCFWIASTQPALGVVCVCCSGHSPVFSNTGSGCSPLWCDTVDSGHPSCFLCWCLLPILVYFHTPPPLRYMYFHSFYYVDISHHFSVKIMQGSHWCLLFSRDTPTMCSLYVCCHMSREGWNNSHVWHLSPRSLLSCVSF